MGLVRFLGAFDVFGRGVEDDAGGEAEVMGKLVYGCD